MQHQQVSGSSTDPTTQPYDASGLPDVRAPGADDDDERYDFLADMSFDDEDDHMFNDEMAAGTGGGGFDESRSSKSPFDDGLEEALRESRKRRLLEDERKRHLLASGKAKPEVKKKPLPPSSVGVGVVSGKHDRHRATTLPERKPKVTNSVLTGIDDEAAAGVEEEAEREEEENELCAELKCLGGGRCVVDWTGSRAAYCQCPLGTDGIHCELGERSSTVNICLSGCLID